MQLQPLGHYFLDAPLQPPGLATRNFHELSPGVIEFTVQVLHPASYMAWKAYVHHGTTDAPEGARDDGSCSLAISLSVCLSVWSNSCVWAWEAQVFRLAAHVALRTHIPH
jgi:hypothetical protein